MATFHINTINFPNPPTVNQTVKLEYKLSTDTSYTLISAGVTVDINGNVLASPTPIITGLTSGQSIDIRAYTLCHSPIQYWVQTEIVP